MPKLDCAVCSNEFYAKPSHIKQGWGKYCSKKCQYESAKTGNVVKCFTCGNSVYRSVKEQLRSQSGNYFCSKSCQTSWRNSQLYIGSNHSNWTTGESSYRQRLLRSQTPKFCQKCQTNDSRVLAVHHKDKNRSNNELGNLAWLCHNCHYLVHHYSDEAVGFLTIPISK